MSKVHWAGAVKGRLKASVKIDPSALCATTIAGRPGESRVVPLLPGATKAPALGREPGEAIDGRVETPEPGGTG